MSIENLTLSRRTLVAGCAAAAALAGCGKKEEAAPASTSSADSKEPLTIGIVQLVEHEALDAAVRGIVDGLAERGWKDGEKIKFDRQNAQADQSNLHNIAARFASEKAALVFAVATPAAQAVASVVKNTPILATAVTDFASAKLVKSNEAPGGMVTGVSDIGPIAEQLKLLTELVPQAKRVGTIYNSSEVNSTYQVDILKEAAKPLGIEIVEATVSNVNDIQQAVVSIRDKVDALYLPTDNVIASAVPALMKVVEPAKLVTVAGERGMTRAGCLGSISIDYYELGKLTGHMGADVLEGKAKPAEMPVQRQKEGKRVFNLRTAEAIGFKIPAKLLEGAETFK